MSRGLPGRVLVVAQRPPPVHGANVMTERFLTALNALGVHTALVEKRFSRRVEDVGRADPRKLARLPGLAHELYVRLRDFRPDVCVMFPSVGPSALLLDCLLLALVRRSGTPYLLYFHGSGYRRYAHAAAPLRQLVGQALRNATGGMVLGAALRADLADFLPAQRLAIVPNGLDHNDVPARPAPEAGTPVRILYLSKLKHEKGAELFIEIAARVHAQRPHTRFTAAGGAESSAYRRHLERRVAALGASAWISLPGAVYGPDKERLFATADVFVFPSLNDAFGLVNLEAMRHGLPVVASAVGAVPDIVANGSTGLLAPPGAVDTLTAHVATLVDDTGLRSAMGRAAQQRFLERFTADRYREHVASALCLLHVPCRDRPQRASNSGQPTAADQSL